MVFNINTNSLPASKSSCSEALHQRLSHVTHLVSFLAFASDIVIGMGILCSAGR